MIRSLLAPVLLALVVTSGAQAATRVAIPGGEIQVEFARESAGPDRAMVLAWVRSSAQAVETYYGRFPVAHLRIVVTPASGRGVGGGRTGRRTRRVDPRPRRRIDERKRPAERLGTGA